MLAGPFGAATEVGASTPARNLLTSARSAPPFTTTASWGPTSWSYNPYAPTGYFAAFGVRLPLAIPEKTSNRVAMFNLIPQLITGYSVNKHNVLTLHLIKGVKFSNGEPVNATDVMDSLLLAGVDQNFVFDNDIKNVTAPNATTVVITFTPVTANVNVRGEIAGITPLPMSQYSQFLPKGIEQTLLQYNKLVQNPKTAASAATSPQYKTISALTAKLQKFTPKTLIGDGPFMLKGIATASATEVKSPTYFDASKVHIKKLTLLNTVTSTANVYPLLYSHDIDWYAGGTPSSTEFAQWKTTPGAHWVSVNHDVTENMLFNNKVYPFTLTSVRQAIAYLLNRKTLVETEDGGTLIGNQPDNLSDGMGKLLTGIWLSKSQRAKLNPYKYSPSKATKLLKAAGFKKVGKHWVEPNGKEFKTQVIAPSTPETAVLFAKQVAAVLTSFGIPATASAVPSASYTTQQEKGRFQIAWGTGVGTNLEPVCGIASGGLGEPTNYTFSSNGAITAGSPGIGFGPSYDVPGQGVVQVSQTSDLECQHTNAGPKLAAYAWDWAQVVNKEVPYLTYADDDTIIFYSSTHYKDWPPTKSWMWQEGGIYTTQSLMIMIEHGYIRPI